MTWHFWFCVCTWSQQGRALTEKTSRREHTCIHPAEGDSKGSFPLSFYFWKHRANMTALWTAPQRLTERELLVARAVIYMLGGKTTGERHSSKCSLFAKVRQSKCAGEERLELEWPILTDPFKWLCFTGPDSQCTHSETVHQNPPHKTELLFLSPQGATQQPSITPASWERPTHRQAGVWRRKTQYRDRVGNSSCMILHFDLMIMIFKYWHADTMESFCMISVV